MPLPPPVPREELHLRRIAMRGFHRSDGLFDIEGRLVDQKTHAVELTSDRTLPAHAPVHDMAVRLCVDDRFLVRSATAVSDVTPHTICPDAAAAVASVIGLTIGAGWSREVLARVGGTKGCTHIVGLLLAMGTTAYQSIGPFLRRSDAAGPGSAPVHLFDTCHAYDREKSLVARYWPEHARRS